MINHVVLFKLKDYPEVEKVKVISELKGMIENLKKEIKEIKYIEVGVNHELYTKNFDIALISHFDNLENLNVYRGHPEHLKVVNRIRETTSERASVDFFF